MRKKIKVKIIEESLWDRLPQYVKDEINGTINSKPKEMVEVVHGEWIMINEQLAKCSVCGGYESTNGKDKTGKGVIFKTQKNFCPNCGARMDGAK